MGDYYGKYFQTPYAIVAPARDFGQETITLLKEGAERIDLAYKGLHESAIIQIADALLTNEKVTAVDLCGNRITDACASRLAEVLVSNTTITAMDLGNSGLSDCALQALAVALESNRSLVALGLCATKVTDVGASHLAKTIEENNTLTCINLSRTRVSDAMKARIEDGAQANSCSFPILLQGTSTETVFHIACFNLAGTEAASVDVAPFDNVATALDRLGSCGKFCKGRHKFVLPDGRLLEKCRPDDLIAQLF